MKKKTTLYFNGTIPLFWKSNILLYKIFYLLFQNIEVINDDTNEEIHREEGSTNNKYNKEQV